MGDGTSIEWTDASWPIHAGCKEISPGCANCYSARLTATRLSKTPKYRGLAIIGKNGHPHFTGETRTHLPHLEWPLKWKAPRKIFVDDMSDLFYEEHSFENIAAVFGVMAACPQHTFQCLTKRAERMREWFAWVDRRADGALSVFPYDDTGWRIRQMLCVMARHAGADVPSHHGGPWPLPNVWLGVSCEDQTAADARIPHLLATPAAVRFVSAEPLLGPIDFARVAPKPIATNALTGRWAVPRADGSKQDPRVHWVIVGGESGPGARPSDLAWIRSVVAQCRTAASSCFVKQLGARPYDSARSDGRFSSFTQWANKANSWIGGSAAVCIDAKGRVCRNGKDMQRAHDEGAFPVSWHVPLDLRSRKGGDMTEWSEDLRVRDFPKERP